MKCVGCLNDEVILYQDKQKALVREPEDALGIVRYNVYILNPITAKWELFKSFIGYFEAKECYNKVGNEDD